MVAKKQLATKQNPDEINTKSKQTQNWPVSLKKVHPRVLLDNLASQAHLGLHCHILPYNKTHTRSTSQGKQTLNWPSTL